MRVHREWISSNYPKDLEAEWRAAWEAATSTASRAGPIVDWDAEAPVLLGEHYDVLVSRAAREMLIARCACVPDVCSQQSAT